MKLVDGIAKSTSVDSSCSSSAGNRQLYSGRSLSRYQRAAIDGYVDMLCDASKKDTNSACNQSDGLTPTLLAAANGQLEALRILVGRGGDPERSSADGSSALHLAAARNHLNCVSFLVNFGVNMWALDNELHTAKDVAAIEQRKEVLDYLDQVMAKQSALNTRQVQKLKERAKVAAEKRLKLLRKAQLKAIKQVERDERLFVKMSANRQLLRAAHSISDIKLVGKSAHASLADDRHKVPRLTSAQSIGNLSSLHQGSPLKKRYPLVASSTRFSLSTTNSDVESAYASSMSSASDYASARPKYSDLVGLSSSSSRNKENVAGCVSKFRWLASDQIQQQQSSLKSNSTLASRLRAIGGVSRKVQLKRMLSSSVESRAAETGKVRESVKSIEQQQQQQQQHQQLRVPLDADPDESAAKTTGSIKSCIKWPPAPTTLSRTTSEPDFGSLVLTSQSSSSSSDASSGGCREQEAATSYESQQHQLLTQCLTQLRMQHEAIHSGEPSGETFADASIRADDLQIRPSVVKKQQHQQRIGHQAKLRPQPTELRDTNPRSATVLSVDSIGSASSFIQRCSALTGKCLPSEPPGAKPLDSGSSTDSSVRSRAQETRGADANNNVAVTTMDEFLAANGLGELAQVFADERIDLEALMLLSEEDMKSLAILLGPRRKLMRAIEVHRASRAKSAPFCMLDTQL